MQVPTMQSLSSGVTPGGANLGSDDPPSYNDILLDELQMLISDFRKDVLELKRLQTEGTEAMEDLDRAMSKAQESSLVIRSKLQETQFEILRSNLTGMVSADTVQLQNTQMSSLYREYHSALKEYLSTQIVSRDKCKERMKKCFQESGISIRDEDLEIVLTEDSLPKDMFIQVTVEQTEDGRQAVSDMEEEHMKHMILELENSIHELGDLIAEIALLIESWARREIRVAMSVAQAPGVGVVTHFPIPILTTAPLANVACTNQNGTLKIHPWKVVCIIFIFIIFLLLWGLISIMRVRH